MIQPKPAIISNRMAVFIFSANVKVMAHPLAGANVDRGVKVEITWDHGKQRG